MIKELNILVLTSLTTPKEKRIQKEPTRRIMQKTIKKGTLVSTGSVTRLKDWIRKNKGSNNTQRYKHVSKINLALKDLYDKSV